MLMPSHLFPPWPSLPWQGALVARQAMDISCIAISPKLKLASCPKNVPSGSKGPLELMASLRPSSRSHHRWNRWNRAKYGREIL